MPERGPFTLEQYACDYCRTKKLRCSREKPKCDNCRPWPRSCTYSRHGVIPRRVRPKFEESTRTNHPPDRPPQIPLESRISNIDASIESLTAAVQNLTQAISTQTTPNHLLKAESGDSRDPQGDLVEDENNTMLYVGSSEASPFLDLASDGLKQLQKSEAGALASDATSGLSDLSEAFAAARFDDDVKRELERVRRERECFFIPDEAEGARLIQIFFDDLDRGAPFFQRPPADLTRDIAFQPSTVDRRWVLLFNCLLSTLVALTEPQNTSLNRKLRWNTFLALDTASLFLEPSLIKIQALVLLATHGQEFTTPSLCWTLISHACRMSQVLGLHTYARTNKEIGSNHEVKQFMFWSLYMMNKSVSLAFGRPPFMTGPIYDGIGFPSTNQLDKFNPHAPRPLYIPSGSNPGTNSLGFGAVYLLQTLKLSKIEGRIPHHLHYDDRLSTSLVINLDWVVMQKAELDLWRKETVEELSRSILNEADTNESPSEENELQLGLQHIQFRYHSLVVFLTRRNSHNKAICLDSTREALGLLRHLVSNSTSTYNGIIWQLLYFPFTHFFTVFGNILSDPASNTRFHDLQLLRDTVSYFDQMKSNHQTAARLKTIAETLTHLAEIYVSPSEGAVQDSVSRMGLPGDPITETSGSDTFSPAIDPTSLLMNLNAQPINDFDPSTFDFSTAFPDDADASFPWLEETGSLVKIREKMQVQLT